MAVEIGALRALLSLDSAAFEKGAKRAQASMGKLQRSLTRAGQSMQRIGRQMTTRMTLPIVAIGTAAVASSLKVVDAQAKMAQSVGGTVRSMQNLGRAAELAGVSQTELEGALTRMTRRISLAERETGPAVKALDQLGLSASNLNNLDADERLRTIVERIREVVPAAQQAGVASEIFGDRVGLAILRLEPDVIERATREIEQFGVAISETDAGRIQDANDAISAIGLASRGLSNQLTTALAPALQTIAEGIASAAQAFSNLEPVTKTIIVTITGLAAALGPATLALGLMASGLATAAGAAKGFAVALFTVRGALIATGFGAIIVAIGTTINGLAKLKAATGSWGEALSAVFDIGKSVFLGIGNTARGLFNILAGVASAITGSFVRAFAEIARSWDALVNGMATAWNAIATTALGEQLGLGELGRSDISGTLGNLADGLFDNAIESIRSGGQQIKDAGQGVADAITNIREILSKPIDAEDTSFSDDAKKKLKEIAAAMNEIGDGGGGAGARAAAGLDQAGDAVESLGDKAEQTADRFGNMVADIVTGARKASDVLNDLLNQLIRGGISSGIGALAKGDGIIASIADAFAGAFNTGGSIPSGKFGIAGERGPEIVRGPAQVTSTASTARMLGGGQVINNIQISAPAGSDVQEERRSNSTGGEDLTILIDQAVSGLARDPSSRLSRTLNTGFGVSPTRRSR